MTTLETNNLLLSPQTEQIAARFADPAYRPNREWASRISKRMHQQCGSIPNVIDTVCALGLMTPGTIELALDCYQIGNNAGQRFIGLELGDGGQPRIHEPSHFKKYEHTTEFAALNDFLARTQTGPEVWAQVTASFPRVIGAYVAAYCLQARISLHTRRPVCVSVFSARVSHAIPDCNSEVIYGGTYQSTVETNVPWDVCPVVAFPELTSMFFDPNQPEIDPLNRQRHLVPFFYDFLFDTASTVIAGFDDFPLWLYPLPVSDKSHTRAILDPVQSVLIERAIHGEAIQKLVKFLGNIRPVTIGMND